MAHGAWRWRYGLWPCGLNLHIWALHAAARVREHDDVAACSQSSFVVINARLGPAVFCRQWILRLS